MTRINNFTINSDFPSFHSNGEVLATFKIPAGQVWGGFGSTTRSYDIKLGAKDSSIRSLMRAGDNWYLCSAYSMDVVVRSSDFPDPWDDRLFVWISRKDDDTISINAQIQNLQPAPVLNKDELTIIARISTFATPF